MAHSNATRVVPAVRLDNKTQTVTGPQVYQDSNSGYSPDLSKSMEPIGWGDKVRLMQRDPTISLVMGAAIAPPMMTAWAIEADVEVPDEVIEFIDQAFQLHRTHLIRTGLTGCIKFGWQGYEKLFTVKDDKLQYKRFKPLLQDITEILVNENGDFYGFTQEPSHSNAIESVVLEAPESMLLNIGVEGTYWYGEAPAFAAEAAFDDKKLVNDAAIRYDQKIAGAHWIIHYPIGTSTIGGVDMDNYDVAMLILQNLESSGRLAVPRKLSGVVKGLDVRNAKEIDAWEIELITAYGSQVPFNARMMYLDNLLVRAFGFPERSILQGQFGTKAEAGEHGTFAIVNIQLRHESLVEQLNWHAVNQLLRLNYGPDVWENKVRIVAAPLADFQQQMLRDIYAEILSNPQGFVAEVGNLDMSAIRGKLDVPALDSASNIELEPVEEPKDPVVDPDADPESTIPETPEEFSAFVKLLHDKVCT